MNRLRPRQRLTSKRWDFTIDLDSLVSPVGYCVGPGALDEPYRARYHDDGHATPEEAAQCYHRFRIDHYLTFSAGPDKPETLHECAATDCVTFTAGWAECEQWKKPLCDTHRTRETVEQLMPVSMEIWSS